MEQVDQLDVIRRIMEVCLEHLVYRALEDKRVIEGDVTHALDAEPTGLTAACEGLVHEVVGDEEMGLQLSYKRETEW